MGQPPLEVRASRNNDDCFCGNNHDHITINDNGSPLVYGDDPRYYGPASVYDWADDNCWPANGYSGPLRTSGNARLSDPDDVSLRPSEGLRDTDDRHESADHSGYRYASFLRPDKHPFYSRWFHNW